MWGELRTALAVLPLVVALTQRSVHCEEAAVVPTGPAKPVRKCRNSPLFTLTLAELDPDTQDVWLEVYDMAGRTWRRWERFFVRREMGRARSGGLTFRAPIEGEYLLRAVAADRAGNAEVKGSGPDSADLVAVYDATAPLVEIIAPAGARNFAPGESFRLVWRTREAYPARAEAVSVEITTDGGRTWRTIASDIQDTGLLRLRAPGAECSATLRVTVWDACGNRGEGLSEDVVVRRPAVARRGPPAPELLDASAIAETGPRAEAAPAVGGAGVGPEQAAWARERYAEGAPALLSGRYDEAVARLSEAVAADPGLEGAWLDLSVALASAGKLDLAEEVLIKTEPRFPTNADLPYNRGLVLVRQGRTGDARTAFDHARHVDPAHADTHWALSVLAVEAGDLASARQRWQDVLRYAPPNSPYRARAISYLRLAGEATSRQ